MAYMYILMFCISCFIFSLQLLETVTEDQLQTVVNMYCTFVGDPHTPLNFKVSLQMYKNGRRKREHGFAQRGENLGFPPSDANLLEPQKSKFKIFPGNTPHDPMKSSVLCMIYSFFLPTKKSCMKSWRAIMCATFTTYKLSLFIQCMYHVMQWFSHYNTMHVISNVFFVHLE